MTVWAGGDVITSTFLNSVQAALDSASWSVDRMTLTPNATYNLQGGGVAGTSLTANFVLPNTSTFVIATGKQRDIHSYWPTFAIQGTSTFIGYHIDYTITASDVNTDSYGLIATGRLTGAGTTKAVYGRSTAAVGSTGVVMGSVFAIEPNATTNGSSACVQQAVDGANGGYGTWTMSNNGGDVGWGHLISETVNVRNAAFGYSAKAASTGSSFRAYDSAGRILFDVDYLGNLNLLGNATALTTGQRVTGDFSNGTRAKRALFKTGTANGGSSLGIIPDGAGANSNVTCHSAADPDNSAFVVLSSTTSLASVNSNKLGTGTAQPLAMQVAGTSVTQYNQDWTVQDTPEQATHGELWTRGAKSEEITLSTVGLTTDSSANLLPANSIIEAVLARVTTTITTTTDWAVGDPTSSARFSAANATLAVGTTSVGLTHQQGSVATDALGPVQTTAAKVRITCTGANPGAGKIRITVFYRTFTPPTS